MLLPPGGITWPWLVSISEVVGPAELDAWDELSLDTLPVVVSVAEDRVALSLAKVNVAALNEDMLLLDSLPPPVDEDGEVLRGLETSLLAEEDVSTAVCLELAEDSELKPDSDGSVATWLELAENSELISDSDVSAAVCPEFAEASELMADNDVSVAVFPELARGSELLPDSDVPAPVVDVVSGLDTEEALPIAVPVTIVAELSEAPSSDDDPVYDPIFMLDMTLLVESFDDEEYTSEVDPLEIRPVVMSPCELLGFEVDVGPPSLDVLPGAKPAVAELPPLGSRVEEITIVVKDDV